MGVLLVLCQVSDSKKRAKITAEIERRHDTAIRLTESAYAIHTEQLPVRVFDELKDYLGADDRLYVFPIRRPYTGYGPRSATEWLSSYLSTRSGF